MSSLISAASEKFGSGRSLMALVGDVEGIETEVELDLVEVFKVTQSATVTTHPIEKGEGTDINRVTDHVEPAPPTVNVTAYLSYNISIDVSKNIKDSEINSVSAKEKLKNLFYWQNTGTVIRLEGYGTGSSGKIGTALNYVKKGGSALFSSVENDYYFGMMDDKIENLLIHNLNSENKTDLGTDIMITFNLTRVKIAEAQTSTRKTSVAGTTEKGATPVNPVKTKKAVDESKQSKLKKGIEEKKK